MTTENVAVLFTDIVGSTELSQGLIQAEADEVRRNHFAVLRRAIEQSGGTEVKNLGDGIMVVFGSASSAIACGVAMQQGVEQGNRGSGPKVGLRVGISGGEASREDDDYFGDPVVEAARLCGRCGDGQILAADIVRMMAGRRNRHPCRPVGALELKGLPDPLETVEVEWEPLGHEGASASIPLPGRLSAVPVTGVVGRGEETELVAEALRRVAVGEGREFVLVSGEAGMGKTTLVAEAARAAVGNGACVLFGHCEEDFAAPYQLFSEAIGHFVRCASEEQLRDHVALHGAELARLVPTLADRLPDLPPSAATDSDSERFLLFAAVVGLLDLIARGQPVVLVFDDLQWADKGSLILLRHLAGSDQARRLLVLGTFRDRELAPGHPLVEALAALHRQSGVSRLDLAGLDGGGVLSFLVSAAGQELDEGLQELARAILEETDGNPFFVGEVVRHLVETGELLQDPTGRWARKASFETTMLPESVRLVISARVGRLGTATGRALSMASVIGRDFDLDVLSHATGSSEDDLLDMLDAATVVAIVRESNDAPGRYRFAHALIQHTLYSELGQSRRSRAHRQVAEALEAIGGGTDNHRTGELARHWLAARPFDRDRAIAYSHQAGDAALRSLAPADAIRHFATALELCRSTDSSDPIQEVDLMIGLGTAERQTGDPAFRRTLLGAAVRADALGDADRLTAAVLANDRGFFSSVGTIDDEKVHVLERTLDRLPPDHPKRALVLATLCSELSQHSELERRRALADEAVLLARGSGSDEIIVRVLNHVFAALFIPELLEQTAAQTEEAEELAIRIGDPVLTFFAVGWRAEAAVHTGQIEEVDRCLDMLGVIAEQLGEPTLRWGELLGRGVRALIAGDPDRADAVAATALEVGTDGGQPDAAVFFGIHTVMASWQRGTIAELVPLLEQSVAENPGLPVFEALLALALADGERVDEAREVLAPRMGSGFVLPMDQLWLSGMTQFAEAVIRCRERAAAQALLDRLAPFGDHVSAAGVATVEGPVCHYLGGLATVIGDLDQACRHFERAAAINARLDAPFFAARTSLEWGRTLVRKSGPGDTDAGRRHLVEARAIASRRGYGTIGRRSDAALRELA